MTDGPSTLRWTSPAPLPERPTVVDRVPLRRSLRLRTAVAMALLAVTLVLATGAVFAHASIDGARQQLRSQAVAQLRAVIATDTFGGVLPSGATRDQGALPERMRAQLGSGIVTFDDGASMWAARRDDQGVIATRVSNMPVQQQWDRLVLVFVGGGVVAAIVAAGVSWFVAGRLTARLRTASTLVNDVIAGARSTTATGDDEVAVLSQGIAETAGALAARLDRERAVTADVAHDLRTPLTALVNAVALLEPGEDAERVRRQVVRLRALVDDLLRLARAQHDDDGEDRTLVPLGQAVAAAVGTAATTEAPHDAIVRLAPGRLDRVLHNLVDNARRHGGDPVSVTVEGTAVEVHDSGPGFPEDLLRDGPRRFGALGTHAGSGIGLAIAAHHVEAMGAVLELENDDRGAVARVTFRSADATT
jgi:signal transduction histidine kinase